MLTKRQIEILEPMAKNIHKEYSYKELKALSKENSDNGFQIAIHRFMEENLISKKSIGTSLLLKANLSNELLYSYITLINHKKLEKSALRIVENLKDGIEKYTLFYSLVVFGSYSDNKQTKKSDLDIAIFIQDKQKESEIKAAISTLKKREFIKLDCHIITNKEFLEMLSANYTNLGKLIAQRNLPLINAGIFYKLLNKGVENGFKY